MSVFRGIFWLRVLARQVKFFFSCCLLCDGFVWLKSSEIFLRFVGVCRGRFSLLMVFRMKLCCCFIILILNLHLRLLLIFALNTSVTDAKGFLDISRLPRYHSKAFSGTKIILYEIRLNQILSTVSFINPEQNK